MVNTSVDDSTRLRYPTFRVREDSVLDAQLDSSIKLAHGSVIDFDVILGLDELGATSTLQKRGVRK